MYASLNWLNEYVSLEGYTVEELSELFSRTGLEVDGIHNYADGLSNLVVGYVKELKPHPDSDHLSVCQVEVGEGKVEQIVCGAPNVAQGQKVITALPGATLPGIEIGNAVLRGVESNGMICSLQELGFSDSLVDPDFADGIFVLPEDAPVGECVIKYLDLDDYILEFDLTPNRADALSMRGIAYEASAVLDRPVKMLERPFADFSSDLSKANELSVKIEGDTSDHYSLRVVEGVTVRKSPLSLQVKLMKAGIRPINNVVDVTNYYLIEAGQPLHAFDYDKLPSKDMGVRFAKDGEVLVTLDEKERKLVDEDIVITSGDKAVALGGVMGGLDTEVTDETTTIAIESAVFNPLYIRKTSTRLNLRSESSARNEKGVNRATVEEVSVDATALIANLGGGSVIDNTVQEVIKEAEDVSVTVPYTALPDKIGIELTKDEIQNVVDRLGFGLKLGEDDFTVTVPPRRWDISIEADVLEEVARIYGYDKIPSTLPVTPSIAGGLNERQRLTRTLRSVCEGVGLNEIISYALTSPKEAELFKSDKYDTVKLLHPMSEDRAVLRQSLFPAMIETCKFNKARNNKPLAFYEVGKVFFSQGLNVQPIEEERLGIFVSGEKTASRWDQDPVKYDFYDIKGMVEEVFENLRLADKVTYVPYQEAAEMHPGRTAKVYLDGDEVGILGQIHPTVATDHDLEVESYFAELDLEKILTYEMPVVQQETISRFPANSRDLALLVDKDTPNASLLDIIKENAGSYLVDVSVFDLYEGDTIPDGKKSLAYHLVFQNPEATLTDKEVDASMSDVQAALEAKGVQIR